VNSESIHNHCAFARTERTNPAAGVDASAESDPRHATMLEIFRECIPLEVGRSTDRLPV
jgi:hypothetical protein